jgi:hypothetical protein
MAEDSNETAGAPAPKDTAGAPSSKNDISGALPEFDSPSLSPADEVAETPAVPEPAIEPTDIVVFAPAAAAAPRPRFRLRPRHKRAALLAASVAMAAALGVVAGMAASGGFAKPKPSISASVSASERQAMQRTIGKLGKEIASLKTSIAAADRSARSQIAKTSERLTSTPAPEITGSIASPPTAVPTPTPRPVMAAHRAPLVPDWSIRYVRDGYVYVGQGQGDTYQVQLGAPLPGLGPVQDVKRQDGRWLVVTSRGLIVAQRDRHYFEQF